MRTRCLGCHGTDLIEQQRLSRVGWERELDKMIGWGAALDAGERTTLAAHLAATFGPAPAVETTPAARAAGEAIFTSRCAACHDDRLVVQQRLTPAGWTREVDKMIGWGAPVNAEEKEALVAYLSAAHPVR